MTGIVKILSALNHQTRLAVLKLLAGVPAAGLTSGDLATRAQVPPASMSTHLGVLADAGLVSSTRSGREVIYRIELDLVEAALGGLLERLVGSPEPPQRYGLPVLRNGDAVITGTGPQEAHDFGKRVRDFAGLSAVIRYPADPSAWDKACTNILTGITPIGLEAPAAGAPAKGQC